MPKREEDPYVTVLDMLSADAFFLDPGAAVKAVLFTKKAQIPALWRQVAAAQYRTVAFGLVHHTEEDLVARFGLAEGDLPRVLVLMPGKRLTYSGTIDLRALSAFVLAAAQQARAAAKAQAPRVREEEWLSLELSGDGAPDADDALRPRFVFRAGDGAQVLRGAPRAEAVPPALAGCLWSRPQGSHADVHALPPCRAAAPPRRRAAAPRGARAGVAADGATAGPGWCGSR
jgi:hypothetical protein